MHDLDHNEDRLRGTYDFPFEFHHIDQAHPRYVMSYHWHVEYEIIRILEGSLTVTLDEKSFIATAGDIIFVHSGILHSGIPENCLYQCIVFDGNVFLKNNSVCAGYMQKIIHQEVSQQPCHQETLQGVSGNGRRKQGPSASPYALCAKRQL